MNTITYKFDKSLYINMTNRCTNVCTFCIKYKWKGKFHGNDLMLTREPAAEEVIKAIGNPKKYKEIVFCGYGDALIRLEEFKEIARWIKDHGGKVRVNTSGHANLYHKRNIVPELKGLVDAISISLNAKDSKQYMALHRPKHGLKSFRAVLAFARQCLKYIPDVTLTAIELPGVDLKQCEKVARRTHARFRIRPYLDESEN
jgi:TatD DNase family protein